MCICGKASDSVYACWDDTGLSLASRGKRQRDANKNLSTTWPQFSPIIHFPKWLLKRPYLLNSTSVTNHSYTTITHMYTYRWMFLIFQKNHTLKVKDYISKLDLKRIMLISLIQKSTRNSGMCVWRSWNRYINGCTLNHNHRMSFSPWEWRILSK